MGKPKLSELESDIGHGNAEVAVVASGEDSIHVNVDDKFVMYGQGELASAYVELCHRYHKESESHHAYFLKTEQAKRRERLAEKSCQCKSQETMRKVTIPFRRVEVLGYENSVNGAKFGRFHGWGTDYEEFESGHGNYTVAIVELKDGTIELVKPSNVKFLRGA